MLPALLLLPALLVAADGKPVVEDGGELLPYEQAFVDRFTEALDAQSVDMLVLLYNLSVMADAASAEPADAAVEFRNGFKSGFLSTRSLEKEALRAHQSDGDYTFLRAIVVDGQRRLLFRMRTPEGATNYHEFILGRNADGEFEAQDIYIHLLGETLVEHISALYKRLYAEAFPTAWERFMGNKGEFIAHAKEMNELNKHVQAKRWQQGLTVYKALPQTMQDQKTFLLLALHCAQNSDEKAYLEFLGRVEKLHGDESWASFMLIDAYYLRKEYAKTYAAIDAIDERVLGDPWLSIMKGGLHYEEGKTAEAKALIRGAIEREPMEVGYWNLVSIALAEKDFVEVGLLLDQLAKHFQLTFPDLTTVPEYKEFCASPAYQDWLKRQP